MEDYFDWDGNPYDAEGYFFICISANGNVIATHNGDRDVYYYEHPDYYNGIEDFLNTVSEPGFGWPIPMTQEEVVELSVRLNLYIITYK
ncbi:MAG: hypothetical protein ACMV1B_01215 [Prevotella sp.]